MPSIGTFKAQPVTQSYVVTQDSNNDEPGPHYFSQESVDSWKASNASDMTDLGGVIIIPSADFSNIVNDLDGNNDYFNNRKTLMDMGKEIVIGNEINSRIIVLRKLMGETGPAQGALGGAVGYVCVENNGTAPYNNSGRFTVRVARA